MTAPYFVHGVELVGCDGDLCRACETRKAIGRSVSGLPVCPRCSGDADYVASEMWREKEESAKRQERRTADDRARVQRAIARLEGRTDPHSATARRTDPAHKVNAEKALRQRGIRQAAVMAVLEQQAHAVPSSYVALVSGLSLATVKRAIVELVQDKQVTVTRVTTRANCLYRAAAE